MNKFGSAWYLKYIVLDEINNYQIMDVPEINGKRLYYTFVAGANKIIENQVFLNKINVFPVNDGDTGSNMASTIRSVIDSIKPHSSYKITVDRIAVATLLSARGNSGIIFAQFLYGLSNETRNINAISVNEFIETVKKSVKYVYEAVANPVEGTMLTVIKIWAEFIDKNRSTFQNFNQLFANSFDVLEKALAETKMKLDVLAKANVVDAGANAFVYFIKGIIEFMKSNNIKSLLKSKAEVHSIANVEDHVVKEVKFRYCTEAVIKDLKLDHDGIYNLLKKYGDSIVIAGSDKVRRIHVHTDNPDLLFDDLHDFGTITFQKADDMLRQSEAVYHRKWNIALVTDSACDLPQELIDNYQIHVLPINIYFGDYHYLDKRTIKPEQFYQRLNSDQNYPKTAQINEIAFRNMYSHLASHYDVVIAVHLTGKFSGTYNNSKKAAEKVSRELNKPIKVFDSKNLSGALGLIVLRIAQEIEKKANFEQIIQNVESWIKDSKIFVSVKTLKYMVKSGRVSPWKGLIAKILNVNPIVSMDESGKSMVFGKTYSQKSNMEKVIRHIKEITRNRKIWNYIVLHANNEKAAKWYADKMKELTNKEMLASVNISPVIGASAGLGTVSVAFMYD